jgi:hypothetical protein
MGHPQFARSAIQGLRHRLRRVTPDQRMMSVDNHKLCQVPESSGSRAQATEWHVRYGRRCTSRATFVVC